MFQSKKVRIAVSLYWVLCTFLLLFPHPDWLFGAMRIETITSNIGPKHIVLFASLAFLSELARSRMNGVFLAVLICFYGFAIELIQPFTGRFFSWYDVLSNVIGVAVGFFAACLFRSR